MKGTKFALLHFCFILCLVYANTAEPTSDIDQLFKDFSQKYLSLRPETGTALGLSRDCGIEVRNDKLDDVSQDGYSRLYSLFRDYRDKLLEYDRNALTESQRISYDKLKWYLDDEIEGEKYLHNTYIIDPMFSFHNNLTTLMTEHHEIRSPRDVDDYIERLKQYDKKISQYLEQLEIRREKGVIAPIFIIERFQESLEEFVSTPASRNILLTSCAIRIDEMDEMDEDRREELKERVKQTITSVVYPSYEKVIEYSQGLRSVADENAGAWRLPDGDNYYEYCLRHHTTTSMTADEIHNLGKAEVKRIQGVLKRHLRSIGYSTDKEYREVIEAFRRSMYKERRNEFLYPDNEMGREQILQDYQAIIDNAKEKIPELFSLIPKTPVVVKKVPGFKEKTSPTYYQPLKLDGSSQGIFYVNLSHEPAKPGMECLAYHEAIPGHHFQIALEKESPDFRLFHTFLHPTGYIEGWALYVERLANEYNWYSNAYSVIGYHNSELFRAVRLVVDTGIHSRKWSREKAHEYMVENLGWGSYKEIDRYITWPGQACAYKVGEMKICELRKKAEMALGEEFSIREFHEVVLRHGRGPLTILEELVDNHIKNRGKNRDSDHF